MTAEVSDFVTSDGPPDTFWQPGGVALTASVIALLVVRAMPDAGTGFTLQLVLLMGGMMGTTFGAVWLFVSWSEAKRDTRLKAGEGVIARWTVDPLRWDWFRQHSKESDKREGVRPNLANLD